MPYLIISTAGNCGACNAFKNKGNKPQSYMSQLESEVSSIVTIKECFRRDMREPFTKPDESSNFVAFVNKKVPGWFPSFCLLSDREYQRILDGDLSVNFKIFNGVLNNGVPSMVDPSKPLSVHSIVEWIRNEVTIEVAEPPSVKTPVLSRIGSHPSHISTVRETKMVFHERR